MNYRHVYHAGNFADVLKHAVMSLILQYMTQKSQPLRVIDVHAGIGCYDLESTEAGKTGEWKDGIGRIFSAHLPDDAARVLAPYLNAVRDVNGPGDLRRYPGSPLLARSLLRRTDAMVANELHPEDVKALKDCLKGMPNTKVTNLDAWVALKSMLPPPERRGLILIDPPFEAREEFTRLAEGLEGALQRFETGTFLIWYPTKDPREVSRFHRNVKGFGLTKLLEVSLATCAQGTQPGLTESGLLIVNPPYVLAGQLACVLPVLSKLMAQGPGAGHTLKDWSV